MNSLYKYDIQVGLPLPLLSVILMPMALLMLPFLWVSCLISAVPFGRGLGMFLQVFRSLRGTHVQIALNRYSFLIHIA